MKKAALLAGAGLVLALAFAWAQPIGNNAISGNECWNAGQGPGGPGAFLCVNTVRGSTPNVVATGASITGNFTLDTTGPPNTTVCGPGGCAVLITSQPSAAVITLPPNPIVDGAVVRICNVSSGAFSTNAITLAANANQTLAVAATLTTLAPGVCASEVWNLATATWYRIQ